MIALLVVAAMGGPTAFAEAPRIVGPLEEGALALRTGDYRAALVAAGNAAADAARDDHDTQSRSLSLRAEALIALGELDEAELALAAALSELIDTPHAERLVHIEVLRAELALRSGRGREAREALADARRWAEALQQDDVDLAVTEARLVAPDGSHAQAAEALARVRASCPSSACEARVDSWLAWVELANGDLVQAQQRLLPALAELRLAGWWAEATRAATTFVRVLLALGDASEARRQAADAVLIASRLEDRARLAELVELQGEATAASGDTRAARVLLQTAQAHWARARSAPGILGNRLVSGRLALDAGELGLARIHLEVARDWAEKLEDAEARVVSRTMLAEIDAREGHVDEARVLLEEALAARPRPRIAAQILMRLGRIEEAVLAAERVPMQRFASAERESVMAERQAIYDARIEQLVAAATPGEGLRMAVAEALTTSERSIARAFIDVLERTRAVRADPALAGVHAELARIETALGQASDDAALARLSRRRAQLEAEALGVTPTPPGIERLAAGLAARLRPDVAVLKFHLGEPRSHLFVVTDQGTTHVELPARTVLAPIAERFAAALSMPRTTPSAKDGRALFDALIAPALVAIGSRRRLVIIPHRELRLVAFDALPLPAGGGFVVELFTTSTAPSIAALVTLEDALSERQSHVRYPLAAFADPVYTGRAASLPRLLRTAEEARAASTALQGEVPQAGALFLRADASEARLKALALGRYRWIHLATHGFAPDTIRADASPTLFLGEGQGEDGMLTLDEVLDLHLDADLVVLSACSSGRGVLEPGDGLGSLVHAFLTAGSAGVLATLWPIEDRHAAQIMQTFYRELAAGRSPAVALRAARLEQVKRTRPADRVGATALRGMGGIVGEEGPGDLLPRLPRRITVSDRAPFFWAPYVLVGATGDVFR